ncbi:MAG: hypothetical protein R6W70_09035 [bacterium]
MAEKMKALVSLLRPGQQITEPVFDENGLLLAGEGSELNERNLYLLKESNVKVVSILKENSFPWQCWKEPSERLKELEKKFSSKEKDKNMKIIKNAIKKRLTEKEKNK